MILKFAFSFAFMFGLLFVSAPAFPQQKVDTTYATNSKIPKILVMYFHGLGSDYSEPFTAPSIQNSIASKILAVVPHVALRSLSNNPNTVLNGRDHYIDVTTSIRETIASHPSIKQIILCGTSLGGYQALAYLHYVPKDLLDKITGVISAEPADDLNELYELTNSQNIKQALITAFDGDPNTRYLIYRNQSLEPLLSNVHTQHPVKICVISATQDRVVPPYQQRRLVRTLKGLKFDATILEINAQHGVKNSEIFAQAIQSVQVATRQTPRI